MAAISFPSGVSAFSARGSIGRDGAVGVLVVGRRVSAGAESAMRAKSPASPEMLGEIRTSILSRIITGVLMAGLLVGCSGGSTYAHGRTPGKNVSIRKSCEMAC